MGALSRDYASFVAMVAGIALEVKRKRCYGGYRRSGHASTMRGSNMNLRAGPSSSILLCHPFRVNPTEPLQ